MTNDCYINMLPYEIMDIIYELSNKLYVGQEWKDGIMYNYLYDLEE